MKKSILLLVIIFLFCFCGVHPVYAVGLVGWSEFSYGRAHFDDYNHYGYKRNFVVGLAMDTNVSTPRIFKYRLNLGLSYTNISAAYSDQEFFYWNGQRVTRPFNDEGYGIHMKHTFGFRVWETPLWRFWIGPNVRMNYDLFTASDREDWRLYSFGAGINLGYHYHYHPTRSLEFILSYEYRGLSSDELAYAKEDALIFRIGLALTKERVQKITPKHEPERTDSPKTKTIDVTKVEMEKDSALVEKNKATHTGKPALKRFDRIKILDGTHIRKSDADSRYDSAIILETYPAICSFKVDHFEMQKNSPLMAIEYLPPGEYDLLFRYQSQELRGSVNVEAGQNVLVSVSFPTKSLITYSLTADRYIRYDDGTVEDINSGLMWLQSDLEESITWPRAVEAAESCRIGGYTDWRLPSQSELTTLLVSRATFLPDRKSLGSSLKVHPLFSLNETRYWSSTIGEHSALLAQDLKSFIDMNSGTIDWSNSFRYYGVIPVRWAGTRALPEPERTMAEIRADVVTNEPPKDLCDAMKCLNYNSFNQKVYSSEKDVIVLFYDTDSPDTGGLVSVCHELAQQWGHLVNFYVLPVTPEERTKIQQNFNYTSPASIHMFSLQNGPRELIDSYSGNFTLPALWKQRHKMLSMWIYSRLIDDVYGHFFRGKYIKLFFDQDNNAENKEVH